jgi:hypothetical protein
MRGAGPAAAMGRSAACTLGGGPLWDTPPQHGPPSPELWRLSPGLDRPAVRGGVSQGDCAQRIAGDSIPRCANARAFHDFGPDLRRARAPQPASAIGAELLAVAVVSVRLCSSWTDTPVMPASLEQLATASGSPPTQLPRCWSPLRSYRDRTSRWRPLLADPGRCRKPHPRSSQRLAVPGSRAELAHPPRRALATWREAIRAGRRLGCRLP